MHSNGPETRPSLDLAGRLAVGTEFPGLPGPAAGFEAPLEMLAACHDRIRARCATLLRLRAHVAASGVDEAARSAARGVLRYFDQAAPDHHEDEERDLFPALLESMAGSDAVCIRDLIEGLTDDHRKLERLWRIVRAWLAAVERGDTAAHGTAEIDAFVDLNGRHAAREDQELLPMAARLLGAGELDEIGQSMRRRRGIT
jgi:hemerythrin-like domain-containing protein